MWPFLLLQLLIGFESGTVVLWDLKSKKADYRYTYDEVTKIFMLIKDLVISLIQNSFSKNLIFIFSLGSIEPRFDICLVTKVL
jgi:hypothetical protein